MSEPVWTKFLTERDKAVFAAAGYGERGGFGKRPVNRQPCFAELLASGQDSEAFVQIAGHHGSQRRVFGGHDDVSAGALKHDAPLRRNTLQDTSVAALLPSGYPAVRRLPGCLHAGGSRRLLIGSARIQAQSFLSPGPASGRCSAVLT